MSPRIGLLYRRLQRLQQHSRFTDQALADNLGVMLSTLHNWRDNGLPPNAIDQCSWLTASEREWIKSGRRPPVKLLSKLLLTSEDGLIDWRSVPRDTVLNTWLDTLRLSLFNRLAAARVPPTLLPGHLQVARWRLINDPEGEVFNQLTSREILDLANTLKCQPRDRVVQDIISGAISHFPSSIRTRTLPNSHQWRGLRAAIEQLTRRLRRLRISHELFMSLADEMIPLVTRQWKEEPPATGADLIPQLSLTVRGAFAAEIIGPRPRRVRQDIESILLDAFGDREFSIGDLCQELGTKKNISINRSRTNDTLAISESTVRRHLEDIAREFAEGKHGIPLRLHMRTWTTRINPDL